MLNDQSRAECFVVCPAALPGLKKLDLSCNSIGLLDASLGVAPTLTVVNLRHNKLATLGDNFAASPLLSELTLSENLLGNIPQCIYQVSQCVWILLARSLAVTSQQILLDIFSRDDSQLGPDCHADDGLADVLRCC